MRNYHNILFDYDSLLNQKLIEMGFNIEFEGILNIVIDEEDKRWEAVYRLMNQFTCSDICSSEFSTQELSISEWMSIFCPWHNGYPMPDNKLIEHMQVTYNLTNYCHACGVGAEQDRPFLVRSEPKWGSKSIMMLNWIMDEYFVRPEIYHEVFLPFGVDYYPVLHYKTRQEIDNIVQLRIDFTLPGPLLLGETEYKICPVCKRMKYKSVSCGKKPSMSLKPEGKYIARSQEYFGDGASAFREIFIHNELYREIELKRVKPLKFTPVR